MFRLFYRKREKNGIDLTKEGRYADENSDFTEEIIG